MKWKILSLVLAVTTLVSFTTATVEGYFLYCAYVPSLGSSPTLATITIGSDPTAPNNSSSSWKTTSRLPKLAPAPADSQSGAPPGTVAINPDDVFAQVNQLNKQMTQMMQNLNTLNNLGNMNIPDPSQAPAADDANQPTIAGEKDHYTVTLKLPGATKSSIHVIVDGQGLTISSEQRLSSQNQNSYSAFEQSFNLPGNTNPKAGSATYASDTLTITLPKSDSETLSAEVPVK